MTLYILPGIMVSTVVLLINYYAPKEPAAALYKPARKGRAR